MFRKLLLVLSFMLVLGIVTACGGDTAADPTAQPAREEAALSETDTAVETSEEVAPTDDLAVVNAAFQRLSDVSYRVRVESLNADDDMAMDMEIIPPDRSRVMILGSETIAIGDTIYYRLEGEWVAQSAPENAVSVVDGFTNSGEGVTAATAEGEESIDDVATTRYAVTISTDTVTENNLVWIDEDGFIRRIQSINEGEDGLQDVITFYDYNADDIVIEAPEVTN